MKTKKIILPESQMPTQWYNIVSDMKNRPLPPLNPATKEPVTLEQMSALFAEELMKQEMSTERYIDIPEEVQDLYKIYRSTPLVRAYGLEKALDTPAKIYFKNESVSPVGSHKTNTAIPQAYYNYKQGIRHLTTETGAGQWGAAMSMATQHFGIDLKVFMVKVSFNQKPYRKLMMNTWGADVYASPSEITAAGRAALAKNPNDSGESGHGDLRSRRNGAAKSSGYPLLFGFCFEPRTVAPDDHRRGGRETDGAVRGVPGRGDRLLRRRQQLRRHQLLVPAR